MRSASRSRMSLLVWYASFTSNGPVAFVAARQSAGSTSVTSQDTARSAAVTASSMSGAAGTRTRPTRGEPAPAATVNPGSSSCMPRISPATSAAIGPTVSMLGVSGRTPSSGMRPQVVFSPQIPQQAAGMRIDPPVSVPYATSASPVATATADPLEDPPGASEASSGFTGVPNQGLIPVTPSASSCRLVRPTTCPPAARSPARQAASLIAGTAASASTRDPAVVGTPAISIRSFTATRWPDPVTGNDVMKVADTVDSLGHGIQRCGDSTVESGHEDGRAGYGAGGSL